MNKTEYKQFLEDKLSFVENLIATEKDKTSLMGYHNTKALLKEIIYKFSDMENKDDVSRKIYYFNVIGGNGYFADGVVIANNEEDAMEKIEKKYPSPFLKIELDYNLMGSSYNDNGIREDKNIAGLFVRWED